MIEILTRAEAISEVTGLRGYVETTIEELEMVFGAVTPDEDADKVTHEWVVRIDGVIVTVYDYKWVATPGQVEWFHVGGGQGDAIKAIQKIFPWAMTDKDRWQR